MERIARHFLANPTRKNQLLALVLKLDFGNNDALENAVVNVHLPHSPGLLDEETLFLQSIVSTYGREHPLGVGDRDLILELRLRNTDPWSLNGDRRLVIAGYPNPDSLYAAIKPSRSLTLPTANCLHSSLLTKNLRSISTGAWCSCSS